MLHSHKKLALISFLSWVVAPCGAMVGCQVGGGMVLQNIGMLPHHYLVSQPRRPRLEFSLL